jgi:hypothetical protein
MRGHERCGSKGTFRYGGRLLREVMEAHVRKALWQEPVRETFEGNAVVQRALFSDPILALVN